MANKTINQIKTTATESDDDDLLVMWVTAQGKTAKINVKNFLKGKLAGMGVSYYGTRAGYEQAKLIPEGNEGHIPNHSLVIITDENDYIEGEDEE